MKRKDIIVMLIVVLSILVFGYCYSKIHELGLGNDIGVILGFVLCMAGTFFALSVDFLLRKPKSDYIPEVNQNEKH